MPPYCPRRVVELHVVVEFYICKCKGGGGVPTRCVSKRLRLEHGTQQCRRTVVSAKRHIDVLSASQFCLNTFPRVLGKSVPENKFKTEFCTRRFQSPSATRRGREADRHLGGGKRRRLAARQGEHHPARLLIHFRYHWGSQLQQKKFKTALGGSPVPLPARSLARSLCHQQPASAKVMGNHASRRVVIKGNQW